MNIALSIAGSDSGGGAGIQADLKTFQELKVYGASVITAVTAQNTLGVSDISSLHPSFVGSQLDAVLQDFELGAIKTGMLFSAEIIEVVAHALQEQAGRRCPVVVDPVMIAKGGASLLQQSAITAMKDTLLPLAAVCTPNVPEAETLLDMSITSDRHLAEAAQRCLALGMQAVIIKGGHMNSGHEVIDYVALADGTRFGLKAPRIETKHTHGTGCTFSAAITAELAKGVTLQQAIITAKQFVHAAIAHPLSIGHGHGPTNHFAYQQYGDKGVVQYVEV